jgi:hypothetical protein
MTHLSRLIQTATKAPEEELPLIAHIMRSDVFHSTLDWQSHEQLVAGAKEAHALLVANRELFDFEQEAAAAVCVELATVAHSHVAVGTSTRP